MPDDDVPHFLVTAGGTREPIDRVRDWGNVFSGNTGYAIARALADVGRVTLVTSNATHLAAMAEAAGLTAASPGGSAVVPSSRFPIRPVAFRSYDDLRLALEGLMLTPGRFDAVVMTAAVSDYSPAGAYQVIERRPQADGSGAEVWVVRPAQEGKVKSTFAELAVLGRRTDKLVDRFRREWGFAGVLVKFKLEVGIDRDRLIEVGQSSRRSSDADYLVANTLDMVDGPGAGAYLLWEGGQRFVARADLPSELVRVCRSVPDRR